MHQEDASNAYAYGASPDEASQLIRTPAVRQDANQTGSPIEDSNARSPPRHQVTGQAHYTGIFTPARQTNSVVSFSVSLIAA